jgi:hypothetical protein
MKRNSFTTAVADPSRVAPSNTSSINGVHSPYNVSNLTTSINTSQPLMTPSSSMGGNASSSSDRNSKHGAPVAPIYDKKDCKIEQVGIRPFSLMFDDDETEKQWNLTHIHRHIGLTSRYLFVAACFQGIFYWGDYIESSAGINAKSSMDAFSNIAFIGLIRLILGECCSQYLECVQYLMCC